MTLLQRVASSVYAQLALIICALIAVYGHTLDVPFYLDDFSSIKENPVIFNWQGQLIELWRFSAARIIGYFSFALNFQIHQFEFPGYHIVNITIHLLTSLAVFAFIRSLLTTPALKAHPQQPYLLLTLPLFAALVFALHPLHVQAVTYIVQRLASLAALFYIVALWTYINARLATPRSKRQIIWAIFCLLATLAAFFTKQNTFTLPIAFLLLDSIFFPYNKKRLIIIAFTVIAGLFITWLSLALMLGKNPLSLDAMQALTRETQAIGRDQYLATQMHVLWTYIRLFFIPTGLHIDYSYSLSTGFTQLTTLFATLLHLGVIGTALYFIRRLPLLTFGILFYYIAHGVESSVIPIRDVIFEHRTYLPDVGLIIATTSSLLIIATRIVQQKIAILTICLTLLIGLSIVTWQRNQLWRDPIQLWQDNVEKAPNKERAWVILGKHLIQANRLDEGIAALEKTIVSIKHENGQIEKRFSVETLLNMIVALKRAQRYDEALEWVALGLQQNLPPFDKAKLLTNQSNIFYALRRYQEAENGYRQALVLYPQSFIARANLASILAATGRLQEAEKMYLILLQIDPNNQVVQSNLQQIRDYLAQQAS